MAKKQDDFDVDLMGDFGDDIDFFSELDDRPLTRIEKAKRFSKGVGGGIVDSLKSSDFIINTLNRAIPDSYNVDLTVLGDIKRTTEDLYRDAGDEARKLNESFKRATRSSYEAAAKHLPKNLRERFEKYYEQAEERQYQQVSEEDSFVGGKLQELLQTTQARNEAREDELDERQARRDVVEDRQHRDVMELGTSTQEALQRLVNFQDKVTSNYQRRSLELGLRHYFVAGKTLQMLTENARVTQDNLKALHEEISKPDILKLREHKDTRRLYGGNRGERGLFGNVMNVTSRIRDNAEKRIRDYIQATVSGAGMALGMIESGGSMVSSMGQMGDTHTTAGNFVGGGIADVGGFVLGNRVRKFLERHRGSQALGKRVSYFTNNYRNMLEENRRGEAIEYDELGNPKLNVRAGLSKLLHGLIGDERGTVNLEQDTLESLQQAHPYTKQTNRTINEVIPGLLSDIRGVLIGIRTGEDGEAVTYDYLSGKFVNRDAQRARVRGDLLANARGDLVKNRTEELVRELDDGTLDDADRRALGLFLLRQSHDRRLASQERLTDLDTFEGLPPEQVERFRGLFEAKFNGEDPHGFLNDFSRKYNTLLNNTQITRDQFHALMQTGQHDALQASGFVRDGKINTDALLEAFLDYDYDQVHADTRQAINTKVETENQAKAEALARSQRVANLFGMGKRKLDETEVGKALNAQAAKAGEALDQTTTEVIERTKEIIEASGLKDLTRDQVVDLMHEVKDQGVERAKDAVNQIRDYDYQGAADAIVEGFKEARNDPRGTLERVSTQGKREARGVWARLRRLGRRGRRAVRDNEYIQSKAQALRDRYDNVSATVLDTAQDILKRAGVPNPSKELVTNVIRDVQTRFTETGVEDDGQTVSLAQAVESLHTQVSAQTTHLPETVAKQVASLRSKVSDAIPQSVKDSVAEKVEGIRDTVNTHTPEPVKAFATSTVSLGKTTYEQANEVLQARAKEAMDRIRKASGASDDTPEDVDASAQYVAETQTEVGQTLAGKLDQIKDAVLASLNYQRDRDAGPRKGSFEDILNQRKAKPGEPIKKNERQAQRKEESGFGLVSTLFKGLSNLTGLVGKGFSGLASLVAGGLGLGALGSAFKVGRLGIGGLLKGGGAALGGLGKLAGWLGGKSAIGRLASTALGGAGSLVGGLGGSVLGTGGVVGGLGSAGSLAGKALNPITGLGRAARTVGGLGSMLKTGAVALGKGAMGALRFAAPLLTNPVFLGVTAAAGVGYLAYKWLTRVTLNPINQMRLVQYGYQGDDLDKLKQLMVAEDQLGRGLIFDGNGIPRVDYQQVDVKELINAFGVSHEDQAGLQRLDQYLIHRFIPVYLTHVGVLKSISKEVDLRKAEKLKGEDLVKYVDGASYPDGPYELMPEPSTGELLPSGRAEVEDFVKSARVYAVESREREEGKRTRNAKYKAILKAAWDFTPMGMASNAVQKLFGTDKAVERRLMEEAKTRPETHYGEAMLKELRPGGKLTNLHERIGGDSTDLDPVKIGQRLTEVFADAGVTSVSSYVTRRFVVPDQIRGEDAIRYKLYGLKTMSVERIRTLLSLEYDLERDIEYDADGKATWQGSVDGLVALYAGRFGLGSINNPATNQLRKWLMARFLPVYLNALSFVYRNSKSTSLEDGKIRLTPNVLGAYVNALTGTMTIDPDTQRPCSVWDVAYDPWDEDGINTDASSIDPNLASIKDRVKNATASEETKTSVTKTTTTPKTLSQPTPYGNRQVTTQLPTTQYLSDLDGYTGGYQGASPGLMGYNEAVKNYDADPWGGRTTFELRQGTGGLVDSLPNPKGDGSYQAYADLIAMAADTVGVDEASLAAMIAIESGFKANAKAPTSTASGLGQFIQSTWQEMVNKYGEQYGIRRGTSPFDPKANVLMTAQFIRNNAEYLKREVGLTSLRPVDVYMAHFLGPAGYAKFIKAGPQAVAAHVNPEAASANRNIFYDKSGRPKAVGEIIAHFSKKLGDKARGMGVALDGGGLGLDTSAQPGNFGQEPTGDGVSVVDLGQGLPNPFNAPQSTNEVIEQAQYQRVNQPSYADPVADSYLASAHYGSTGQAPNRSYQLPSTGGSAGGVGGTVASGDKVKAFVASLNPKYIELGMRNAYAQNDGVDLKGMNQDFMLIFYAMVGEYVARGGSKVQINSAYRSVAKQKQLYEAWIANGKRGGAVAKPGNSRHGKGIAIDINSSSANALQACGLLGKYNFHRPVKGEAWHLENYLFGDAKATTKAMADVAQEAKRKDTPKQTNRLGYEGDASDPQGVNVQEVITAQAERQSTARYVGQDLTPRLAEEVTQQHTGTENTPTQRYQGRALELSELQLQTLSNIHSVLIDIHKAIPGFGLGATKPAEPTRAPTTESRSSAKPSADLLKPAVSMNRQI